MGAETKSRKIRRLKGSVLFTTLVVMILILLIMLAAIGLAGAASKKAYSTWYDNQTKYTAQDLVDNVIELLGPTSKDEDMKALGKSIVDSLGTKKNSVTLDVTSNGSKKLPGYGTVNSLTFTYVADNKSDFTILGLEGHDNEKIIKVTASVTMGGETSTYSTYVVGNKLGNSTDSNGGGFIATGTLKSGDNGSQDGPGTIGRMYAGIEVDDANKYNGGAANDSLFGGDVFLNYKEFTMAESGTKICLGRNDPENGYYGGMRLTGDVKIDKALLVDVVSNYPPSHITDLSAEKFYNIPYLYIDGKLYGGKGLKVTGLSGSDKDGMLNLYCNELEIYNNGQMDGNINIMIRGENTDNSMDLSSSKLTNWASEVTGRTEVAQLKTGNFYCKGKFTLKGNNKLTVNGDMCVVGDLEATGPGGIDVKGKLYVGGEIKDPNNKISSETNVKEQGLCGANKGSAEAFYNALSTKDPTVASHYDTAFTTDSDGKSYIQTIENIKKMIRTSEGKFVGVEEESGYSGPNDFVCSSTTETITESCNWNASSDLNTDVAKTIYIDPGDENLWINIQNDLNTINYKTIIIKDKDDLGNVQKGSVKFFIEEKDSGRNMEFRGTKIMTQTYFDYLCAKDDHGNWMPQVSDKSLFDKKLELTCYPGGELVPHVFMYSPSESVVNIYATNGFMYTGDIVMPNGSFKAEAVNTTKKIKYTYYMYESGSTELKNPVVIDSDIGDPDEKKNMRKISFIGSLEVKDIEVDNKYGYFYVDDPPLAEEDPGDTDEYSWTTLEGYSTY